MLEFSNSNNRWDECYEAMDAWKEFTIITEDVGSASSGTGVIGDVNGDGFVDVKDVTALINLILK